jgi:RNA polymerase sigma factor (sigma-70 family)
MRGATSETVGAWLIQTERVGMSDDLAGAPATPPLAGPEQRAQRLARLVAASGRRGFAIAFDLLGERAEAEDAVQEALARACASVAGLREDAALEGWFFRVLTNVCLRVLRRRRVWRLVRGLLPFAGGGAGGDRVGATVGAAVGDAQRSATTVDPASDAPAADDALARGREVTRLLGLLDGLPSRQRAALVLRYGHDLPIAEIAAMLGVGPGTVKTHLVRGLTRLRHQLAAREEPT